MRIYFRQVQFQVLHVTCHKGVFICSSAEMGLKPRLGFEVRAGPMQTGYFALFHLEFNMIVIAVGAEGEWVRYHNLVQWAPSCGPQHTVSDRYRPVREPQFETRFAGGSIVVRRRFLACVVC